MLEDGDGGGSGRFKLWTELAAAIVVGCAYPWPNYLSVRTGPCAVYCGLPRSEQVEILVIGRRYV